ncbi:MAG: hypothetical protein K9G05_04850 [Candidatus Nanopelagicales bacterium]|nr:hypothetical protein [Candidatus Nanopelagicales bacterium]MCF8539286.1 hypothetical protein [Candidatus Nanopelagicales bacterium]MCF8551392.1 hypothetical protein [Candidatus Nanopelagicales bacterium]
MTQQWCAAGVRLGMASAMVGALLIAPIAQSFAAETQTTQQTVCVHKKKGTVKIFPVARKCPKGQVSLAFDADIAGSRGEQGNQGAQGMQGVQGPAGAAGGTGPAGATGAPGATGAQGVPGIGTVWSGSISGIVNIGGSTEVEVASIAGVTAGDYLVLPSIEIDPMAAALDGGYVLCRPFDVDGSLASGLDETWLKTSVMIYSAVSLISLNADGVVSMKCSADNGGRGGLAVGTVDASGSFYLVPVGQTLP